MTESFRRYLGEFIGTFGIVFAPVALSCANAAGFAHTDLVAAAVVSGIVVTAMIYALGPICQAHFNPAVSLGFLVTGKFPSKWLAGYITAQFFGAFAAASVAKLIFGVAAGTHQPTHITPIAAAVFETIITFILMFVIYTSAMEKSNSSTVPALAIGITVIVNVLIAGSVTGGSMNPARSFGPALVAGPEALQHVWIYFVGPIVGALVGAFTAKSLMKLDESPSTVTIH
ncbi:MAG: aquaporin [Chthonomonadales bacterium]